MIELRIHGDNIVECENALKLISKSFGVKDSKVNFIEGPVFAPIFKIEINKKVFIKIQLFPGYGRWGSDLTNYLYNRGAIIREAADAIITKLIKVNGEILEDPIIALEFCGALPAGNNAWQRCGRALALAYAKIPYFYYAEIGGVELDNERAIKAPRFPNPLVPLSYLLIGKDEAAASLPIYLPSPSINNELYKIFNKCFGYTESLKLLKEIILGREINTKPLENKAAEVIKILCSQRKIDSREISSDDWDELLSYASGKERADWLINKNISWHKKTGMKGLTKTFSRLIRIVEKDAVAVMSREMPFCLVSSKNRKKLALEVKSLYKNRIDDETINWINNGDKHLVCVFIAGFKPRGDDSRPDRGLLPLSRMIFGKNDIDFLTIVYGPAQKEAWRKLKNGADSLAKTNGLWEALLGLSNVILVDSKTSRNINNVGFIIKEKINTKEVTNLPLTSAYPNFGEHDVDTVLHLIFSRGNDLGIYESLCNPPGGDWSGISIIDFRTKEEYRWTSLPRVSGDLTKRPDHLVQFNLRNSLLSIESKDHPKTIEKLIGPRLKQYVDKLIKNQPISIRKNKNSSWKLFNNKIKNNFSIYSGIAFRFISEESLKEYLNFGKAEIAFGVEFNKNKETIIHIIVSEKIKFLLPLIIRRINSFKPYMKYKIYQ
jgi:hypothetical protein